MLELSSSPSPTVQLQAVWALANLAVDEEVKRALHELSAISVLVTRLELLLGWRDEEVLRADIAEGTLQQLTRCCANLLVRADCREALVESGGLRAIIGAAAACDGKEDVLAAVARALANLTFDLKMAALAVREGALPHLVAMLWSPSTQLQQEATSAVLNISAAGGSHGAAWLERSFREDKDAKDAAAAPAAAEGAASSERAGAAGMDTPLAALRSEQSPSDAAAGEAAFAFSAAASSSAAAERSSADTDEGPLASSGTTPHEDALVACGALEPLVMLLHRDNSETVIEHAALALANIAGKEATKRALLQLNTLEMLTRLRTGTSSQRVQDAVSRTLSKLGEVLTPTSRRVVTDPLETSVRGARFNRRSSPLAAPPHVADPAPSASRSGR